LNKDGKDDIMTLIVFFQSVMIQQDIFGTPEQEKLPQSSMLLVDICVLTYYK